MAKVLQLVLSRGGGDGRGPGLPGRVPGGGGGGGGGVGWREEPQIVMNTMNTVNFNKNHPSFYTSRICKLSAIVKYP